uniref:Uncharacterized protein n=1 Tax=Stomoxys calcitrans TaxID=35570 RepID=A0A1I8PA03_STOCA
MQNNKPSSNSGFPNSPPPKPQRSPSLNLPYATTSIPPTRMQEFPPHPILQRFSLTATNVGMEPSQLSPKHKGNLNKQGDFQRDTMDGNYDSHIAQYRSMPSTNRNPLSDTNMRAAISPPNTPTNDRHRPTNPHQRTSLQEPPTSYLEEHAHKFRSNSDVVYIGDTARINGELNNVFQRRLSDIEANAQGDINLKLVTYQEWVDMLLKTNESLISNMEQLESEVAERLEYLQRRVNSNCRHSQSNELMKSRKDIDTLVKFIQNSCEIKTANLAGITLETISPCQVFGLSEQQLENINLEGNMQQMGNITDPELVQRNKLYANIKALALEVADKHDEVRELKRQVVCLEDEIQKATKKIQLKEDVIKELRNDLKRSNAKITGEPYSSMTSLNMDSPRSEASTLVSEGNFPKDFSDYPLTQFELLNQCTGDKVKDLDAEINQFFEQVHKKPLPEIIKKMESEKAEAYRKLDFLRNHLMDLEAFHETTVGEADNDSGISSKNEYDHEIRILDTVRKRLRHLNENNLELNKRVQNLQHKNDELNATLEAERNIAQRSSVTFKELADLLCGMNADFSYTNICKNATNQGEPNPFCKAIMDMKLKNEETEGKLLQTIANKNQKIEELSSALMKREKFVEQQKNMNNNLKCQIHQLEQNLTASEQHILHLTTLLNRSAPTPAVEFSCRANTLEHPSAAPIAYTNQSCNCQHQIAELEKRLEKISKDLDDSRRQEHFLRSETRKLNEELNESKRKNANLYAQSQRLAGLLKSQESHRMELAQKFDSLEKNFEDQSKKLRAAHTQLQVLNERYKLMERTEMEHKMEGDLLRKEVLSLKEKEAIVVGRQKSLQEQMIKTEKELYNAHEVIQKQQAILRSNDVRHSGELRQLREEKLDAQRNIRILEEDYQRLREAYDDLHCYSLQKRTGNF